ncbi:hypothetical protein E1963_11480 [Extibacter muris]|uniref:Uncharacterized protein n=1 Tax=Extibacter muris TaxID=1796622 RepID=A0A4R4FEW8_9FIRM|nr:hypothetical protein [Extibacter muris]TDA21293.1 hypothetical protein E1963_11480 [Extibacter muris]
MYALKNTKKTSSRSLHAIVYGEERKYFMKSHMAANWIVFTAAFSRCWLRAAFPVLDNIIAEFLRRHAELILKSKPFFVSFQRHSNQVLADYLYLKKRKGKGGQVTDHILYGNVIFSALDIGSHVVVFFF